VDWVLFTRPFFFPLWCQTALNKAKSPPPPPPTNPALMVFYGHLMYFCTSIVYKHYF
jgi:hypothetical protein